MRRGNIFNQSGSIYYNNKPNFFNLNPPKTKDGFNNNNLFINDNDFNKKIINANKKDSVKECLHNHTLVTYYNNYRKYTTINDLKRRSKQIQKFESYRYNYNELNNNYKKNFYK